MTGMAVTDWPPAPRLDPAEIAATARAVARRLRWPAALAAAAFAGWQTGRALVVHLTWMVLS